MSTNSSRVHQHAPILQQLAANNSQSPTEYQEKSVEQFMDDTTTTQPPQEVAHDDTKPHLIPVDHVEPYTVESRLSGFKNRLHLSVDQLINGKYTPALLIAAEAKKRGAKCIVLANGTGAGKTEAFKTILHDLYNGQGVLLSHRVALVTSTADRLGIANYQDIKAVGIGGDTYNAYAGCIHSQPRMVSLDAVQSAFGGVVGLDESESIAMEFLTSTIKNEPIVLDALRKTTNHAGAVFVMDAYAGGTTIAMLNALGIGEDDVMLVTSDAQEFAGYLAKIWTEDEGKSAKKTAFIGAILRDIGDGKRVLVTSLSKTVLDEIEKLIHDRYPDLKAKTIKVTSDTSASSAAKELDADTYHLYTVILLSPSMSTGVSFNKDHADTFYHFAINGEGTGTPFDTLQALHRDRAIKSKTLNIYYQHINGAGTPDAIALGWHNQERAITEEINRLSTSDRDRLLKIVRPQVMDTSRFLRIIAIEQASSKANFYDILKVELLAKGAKIEECGIDELGDTDLTGEDRKEAKVQAEEMRIDGVSQAPKISQMDAEVLKSGFDKQAKADIIERLQLDTPQKVKAVLDRHFVERETAKNLDDLDDDDRLALIVGTLDDGLISKIRKWEIAGASQTDLRRITRAALVGVQADENDEVGFAGKLSSDKFLWADMGHYGRMVLRAVGIDFDESGMVSWDGDDKLSSARMRNPRDRGHALHRACSKNAKGLIESGLLPILTVPMLLKNNLAEYMPKIMEGYGVKLKKIRGTKPAEYRIDAASVGKMLDMVNGRVAAGKNAVSERLANMDEYLMKAPIRKERAAMKFADFMSVAVDVAETDEQKLMREIAEFNGKMRKELADLKANNEPF